MNKKGLEKEIIIDFTNIDFKSLKETEDILYDDSYSEVIKFLREDLEIEIENSMEFEDFHRTHNAIFIQGGRGSGKTQFLLNLKRVEYTARFKDDKKVKQLYFIGPIDPTILHDNESFLTIVLARILNQIEPELKRIDDPEKKSFYELLKSISFAIDGVINKKNSNKTALEHIAQDQSSLKLESYLHNFFKEVSEIVNNKRLVLLIDDIDMAFDKGFEILEVIRKYLSSPYLVPIITGDKWLYEDILEKHFFTQLQNEYFKNKYYLDFFEMEHYPRDIIEELQKDYLTKVLPQHRRVNLESLFELGEKKLLIFRYEKDNILDDFTFKQKEFKGHFYSSALKKDNNLTSSEEIVENLFSNSLRKIVQFLHGEYQLGIENSQQFNFTEKLYIKDIEKKYSLRILPKLSDYEQLYRDGQNKFKEGSLKEALEFFKQSLQLKESLPTLESIGHTYFALANYEKAIEFFYRVLDLDNTNPNAYYKIAYSFSQLEEHKKAIENYKKVLEILPSSANTYNSLGLSQIALNQYEKAFASYKKSIGLKENYYKPYINILEIALTRESFSKKHKKEIDRLEKEFNDKFQEDKVALKYYGMIKLLNKIYTNSKDVEGEFEKWQKEYKDIMVRGWDFKIIERWIETIDTKKKKDILLKYIEKFKESM